MRATKAATSSSVLPSVHVKLVVSSDALPPSAPDSGGRTTSTSTIARSSTTSQPMATRPGPDSSAPRASSALSRTTVLATDRVSPKTIDAPSGQPHHVAAPAPSAVAATICTMAPGNAMRRTESRSASEKCRPTPNMSSMTPISASCPAMSASATNPGVAGPMTTPANRYPRSAGNPSLAAAKPSTSARPNPTASVLIRLTACGIAEPLSRVWTVLRERRQICSYARTTSSGLL